MSTSFATNFPSVPAQDSLNQPPLHPEQAYDAGVGWLLDLDLPSVASPALGRLPRRSYEILSRFASRFFSL